MKMNTNNTDHIVKLDRFYAIKKELKSELELELRAHQMRGISAVISQIVVKTFDELRAII